MSAIPRIVDNLAEQVRLYRRLLELTVAQHEALRAQDVRGVHDVLQQIEMAMLEREQVEHRRAELLRAIAAEVGCPVEEITASLLQELTDAPVARAIADASAELRQLVSELDAIVGKNRVLLEHELAVIDHMVKGMTAPPVAPPTYGKSGEQRELPRLKILDAQV